MHPTILMHVSPSIIMEGSLTMDSYEVIAGCKNGNCPKVIVQGNRVFVQGTTANTDQFDLPAGEGIVEIPLDVLRELRGEVQA